MNKFFFSKSGEFITCNVQGKYVGGKKINNILTRALDHGVHTMTAQTILEVFLALDIITEDDYHAIMEGGTSHEV